MAAPKGNKYAIGNEGGRPTLHKESYNEQVYKLCLLGATDKEIADFFNVTETTINNWKKEHTEFFESIKRGKKIADMEVAFTMYQSTQDRTVKEQQAVKCKEVFWKDGKRHEKEHVELVDVEKIIPANERNQQFWLKNRKTDQWRDKQIVDHTTNGKEINQRTIPIVLTDGRSYEDLKNELQPE